MLNIHISNKQLDTTKVSSIFHRLGQKDLNEKTKIKELLEDFHENGLLLTLIFFAFPIAVPLPYPPGFTTILAAPLLILSIQMMLGLKKVYLPPKISNYEIKNSILLNISKKITPIIKWVEKFIKPRYSFAKSVACEQIIGLIALICSVSIAIPLPLTNAVPALGIVVMALGLLNRDGAVIILGIITSIIGLVVASLALAASWIGIKYLINLIF